MFNWTNWPDWVVFVVITIVGVLAVLAALVTVRSLLKRTAKIVRRCYWAIRFRWTFGLWPSKDPLMRKIGQAAVDETLRCLEEPFRELCRSQEELDQRYSCEKAKKDPWKDFPHARDIKWNLWWAKRKFYGACDTTKKCGFVVQRRRRWDDEQENLSRH